MTESKPTRTLKLVADQAGPDAESEHCQTCDARRQLEHVRMLLNAALLAANKPVNPSPRERR